MMLSGSGLSVTGLLATSWVVLGPSRWVALAGLDVRRVAGSEDRVIVSRPHPSPHCVVLLVGG
jgi:hypothetical protein